MANRRYKVLPDIRGPLRVFGYFRVSTGRQALSDLSIPDQRRQAVAYCAQRGWTFEGEFVDQISGTNEDRRHFQQMIDKSCADDNPVDVVLVHSLSRFFRGAFEVEWYARQLEKAGVRLVSITQDLGDTPEQVMMRQIISSFDENLSRQIGKHVLRSMEENARQGFYNGSPLPLGYMTVEVEKRGIRIKKKLAVDPIEATTVKLIFQLYRLGDGVGGPLGLKATACWLNERGYRTRRGARFGLGTIHSILTNSTYIGLSVFNKRSSKTLLLKPESEHIVVEVPAIIAQDEFEAVAATLKSRDPRVTAPRVVTGPILLTGLAHCATCEGAMTLRTGTSKGGKVHKYYTCSTCARMGKTACKGRSVPMGKLDTLVTRHLVDRLFDPERLVEILSAVADRRAKEKQQLDKRAVALRAEASGAGEKIKRLYSLVENGLSDLDDILKDRLTNLKLDRDRALGALDRISCSDTDTGTISPEAIEKFGRAMRENITTGDTPFRKAYIQSVVDRIEVDDEVVRITGSKATLEQVIAGKAVGSAGVRSFERNWRAQGESNPCFRRERATS